MFENTIFRFLGIYILRILALCIPFVLSSCFEENLLPEDVEYRKDENGTEILFEIEAEEPFGSPKRAYVSEKHPNGEPHFKIGFSHGLKDGPFHFWQDNGLKLFGSDGFKLNDEVENEIQLRMTNGPILAKSENLGRARRMEDAIGRYSEFVKQILSKREDLSSMKVVLDCSNGASYKVGPEVLFELGADSVIIGAEPNGKNINLECGAMYPEYMAKITKLEGADLGIALDGDADRVIFSDENGKIIDGDQIIAVLAREMQKNDELSDNQVVGTLMSNLGLENYLNNLNICFHRTNVGDRYILDKMIKSNSKLGGEPSGHILLADFAKTGDGLLTAIKILSLLKKSGLKASEFLRPFNPIPQSLTNLKNIDKNILSNKTIIALVKQQQELLGNKGRILLRPSGTENLIRIMVESNDINLVNKTTEKISEAILKENDK